MSYTTPVFIESRVSTPLLMGLVMSFSSIVGLACDFIFSRLFPGKSFHLLYWLTFFVALLFPVIFLVFPPEIATLILGVGIWGVYYELIQFTNYHFVNNRIPQARFASAWGLISVVKGFAYLVGPIIAAYLISLSFAHTFLSSIIFYCASALTFLFLFRLHTRPPVTAPPTPASQPVALSKITSIWSALWHKTWPIYIFFVTCFLIDSAFWTIGTLFSEILRAKSFLGNFLLPAYTLPSLFIGSLAGLAAKPFGKKRAAFATAILAGLLLIPVGFVTSTPAILVLVLLSSMGSAITFPEIEATYEDYMHRLGKSGDVVVGMESSASSVAYIIGPIIAGGIGSLLGYPKTFSVLGGLLVVISLLALVIVPRKVRLPQQEIAAVLE